ncbi:MAG: response regulator [candidate division Zixibacteria bacterium]|nr:response regulator [candidate division Zixibacteria bacterium]
MKHKANILLVDDEKGMCDSLKTLLEMENYQVQATTNPEKALELLAENDFDLIITDIKMPKVSGLEILRRARQRDPYLEVILMTGYASLASAKEAVDQGAFGYLAKPVEFEELKITIARSLEKRHTAIEKERLLDELTIANTKLRQSLAQFDALYSASTILASTIDLTEALTQILSLAIDVIGARIGSVMILDPNKQELYIGAACGLANEIVSNTRMKVGSSISGYVAKTGKPLMIDNIEKDPRFSRINRQHYESKSLISVPLQYKGNILGVINLNNKINGAPFDNDDLRILSSLAAQAAIAIDRANIFGERVEKINELSILFDITRKISTIDDIDKVGETIYFEMRKLIHNIQAIFWFGLIERTNSLRLELHYESERCGPERLFPTELKIAKEVIGIGQDVDINTIGGQLLNSFAEYAARNKFATEIIPVQLRGAISGFMVILSDGALSATGQNLSTIVAAQAASIYERQKAVLNATKLVSMGKMISEICHDLKKPLTNIKGNIQIYRDKFDGPLADEFFAGSEKELNRLHELVKEIVNFANPNKYYTQRESLKNVVEKVAELLARDFQKKNIDFQLVCETVPDIEINRNEILESILNIILNAVESMESGGRIIVKIGPHPKAEPYVHMTISDTGCGIPENELPKIFERYYTTKETGTGLGLAIVERVIAAHNGRLTVESKVGEGTTFKIDLPI